MRKRYRSALAWIFFIETIFFHPKQLKCIAKGIRDIWNNLPLPIYRKRGEEVAAQLTQASWIASSISNPASKLFRKAQIQKFENFYLHPQLDKLTPHFVFSFFFPSETSQIQYICIYHYIVPLS